MIIGGEMKKIGIFFTVSIFFVFALGLNAQAKNPGELKWQSTAFGQSVDLNFSSTITPEKVGINGAIPEFPGTINGKIVLESRGGKIAKAHDGIAFYYTVIDPTKNNFVLEADIFVEQFGPLTNVAPNSQTACGLMVRDVNGEPRKEPMVFGYEELPAASNLAAVAVFSNQKTIVEADAVLRNGIMYAWGNPDSRLTQDVMKKDIPTEKPFKLKLERTDTSFIMTYSDIDGANAVTKEYSGTADIVQVVDKNKMYLGFFAARNAKMIVSNAKITLTPANTKPGTPYTPAAYPQFFEIESSDGSSVDSYTLVARTGYSGTLTIQKDGKLLKENEKIKGGDFYKLAVTLTGKSTKFDLTFTPAEGQKSEPITRSITVEKKILNNGKGLVASPNGKPDAKGTAEDPLDAATAVKFAVPGETVFLKGGSYNEIKIGRLYSGIAGKLKKLAPYKNEKPVIKGLSTQASFWHFYGLEAAGSKTYGIWIEGNNNIIEACVAHNNQNSGFQMDSPVRIPVMRTSNNLYLNCESYDNVDPTMENADGYAAKTFTGKGNIYRGCIAHHNADDGWDLFNNMQDGPIGAIVMENCIAYENGITTEGKTAGGAIGNGFKLGGEGQPVPHVIKNSIAFGNRMDGFTCNFNPGSLVVENCTAFDNLRCNYIFRSNPYIKPSGVYRNNISYRTESIKKFDDFIAGSVNEFNLFYYGKNDPKIKESDFVSMKAPAVYKRDVKGNIILGDFLRLSPASALLKSGKNGIYMGALPPLK
jgi:pectate disaccharide-lyase